MVGSELAAVAVIVVIVMLIAFGRAVFSVPSFPVCRPSDEGDDGGSKLHTVLCECVLDAGRYFVEVFACDKSTVLESAQGIG